MCGTICTALTDLPPLLAGPPTGISGAVMTPHARPAPPQVGSTSTGWLLLERCVCSMLRCHVPAPGPQFIA